jgi:hypothetical protein
MIGPAPICFDCIHYRPSDDDDEPMKCDAYPDGIPDEIIMNDLDHTVPLPGDNGIQFSPRE